jgi:plastocyanin
MRIMLAAAIVMAAFAAQAADIEVKMAGAQYAPEQVKAKVGDTLVFKNDDMMDHAVFVPTNGFGVHLGGQKPGQTKSLALKQEGAFEVECVVHPNMVTKVTVTK